MMRFMLLAIVESVRIWYYMLGVDLQTNNSVSAPDHADIGDSNLPI